MNKYDFAYIDFADLEKIFKEDFLRLGEGDDKFMIYMKDYVNLIVNAPSMLKLNWKLS